MLDNILYVVDTSDMTLQLLQSVLSPFLNVGTLIDSFHSPGNSSLLQLELVSLLVSERIPLAPALITSAGI